MTTGAIFWLIVFGIAGLMFFVITAPLLAGGTIALALTGSDLREVYELARSHRKPPGPGPKQTPDIR